MRRMQEKKTELHPINTLCIAQREKEPSDEAFVKLICECELEA